MVLFLDFEISNSRSGHRFGGVGTCRVNVCCTHAWTFPYVRKTVNLYTPEWIQELTNINFNVERENLE